MTRLRLFLRVARCILFHVVRQRQGALRCHTCTPRKARKGKP